MPESENNSLQSVFTALMMMNKPEEGFENRIEDAVNHIKEETQYSTTVNDAYGNKLLAIGTDDKVAPFSDYSMTNDTLNWMLWLALYNDSWVFKKAIDKPARDEVRCGITFTDESDKEKVYAKLKKSRMDNIKLLQWGALFGGAVAVKMYDNFNDEDYARPLDRKKVREAKTSRFYVVDRWYGVSPSYGTLVDSMSSLDYGKPKYYDITFPDGHSLKVHHDYVVRYEHRTAPQLVKAGLLQGWGYCEGSHIINELRRDEKFKTTIQSLMNKALIEVIKMPGMKGIYLGADDANSEQLQNRLGMVTWGRNYNSLTFLDKEDDYSMNSFSGLSGLSDLMRDNMWIISAALDMPGILFGDLKTGFANDTDAMVRYDDTINGRCEEFLRPVYDKELRLIYAELGLKEDYDYTFNSLIMKKQDKDKMDSLASFTGLADTLLNAGVIDTRLYAKAVQGYLTDGVIDFGLTDEVIESLSDKFESEMESAVDLSAPTEQKETEDSVPDIPPRRKRLWLK